LIIICLVFSFLTPTAFAAKLDIGVKEGDTYRYKITQLNDTAYPDLNIGDARYFLIETLEYSVTEGLWYVYYQWLDFSEEEVEDLPTFSYTTVKENGSLTFWIGFCIPKTDVSKYLSDYAATNGFYTSSGNSFTSSIAGKNSTYIYNDNGILTKFTEEDAYSILYQYELIEGIISFGFGFFTFIFIALIGCIIYYLKKIKRGMSLES
jgi:hypothetical protein